MSNPILIPQPFGNNATGGNINVIPNTTGVAGRASYDVGFPPVTMQPVIAGGIPPLGQDVNGILYAVSAHAYFAQSGQLYVYDSLVATAIGGYAVGTVLGMADGTGVWFNNAAANMSDPDAGGAGWVPLFSYGITTLGIVAGVNTLTAAQARRNVIVLTGVLGGNAQVVLPNTVQRWLIVNSTSGGFTTTVKTAAGTGVTVPPGGFAAPLEVWGNGTNIYPTVAPVSLPIDQAATPLTIAQRTNAGYLLATYFNQSSALENFSVSAVFAQTGADGYLRKISLANLMAQVSFAMIAGTVSDAQVPQSAVTQHSAALFASAALTGLPTAPTQPQGTNDTTIATTAFVQASGLSGAGRVWQNVLGSRALNTPFVNSLGYPINVAVSNLMNNSAGLVQAFCDGVEVGRSSTNTSTGWMSISFSVSPGSTYQINQSGGNFGITWAEQF